MSPTSLLSVPHPFGTLSPPFFQFLLLSYTIFPLDGTPLDAATLAPRTPTHTRSCVQLKEVALTYIHVRKDREARSRLGDSRLCKCNACITYIDDDVRRICTWRYAHVRLYGSARRRRRGEFLVVRKYVARFTASDGYTGNPADDGKSRANVLQLHLIPRIIIVIQFTITVMLSFATAG